MWTRKSRWLFLFIRIKRVPIPLIVPLRIFWECIDALEDLLALFGKCIKGLDARKAVRSVAEAVWSVVSIGKFDLVDVEAGDGVKIKICLR